MGNFPYFKSRQTPVLEIVWEKQILKAIMFKDFLSAINRSDHMTVWKKNLASLKGNIYQCACFRKFKQIARCLPNGIKWIQNISEWQTANTLGYKTKFKDGVTYVIQFQITTLLLGYSLFHSSTFYSYSTGNSQSYQYLHFWRNDVLILLA